MPTTVGYKLGPSYLETHMSRLVPTGRPLSSSSCCDGAIDRSTSEDDADVGIAEP